MLCGQPKTGYKHYNADMIQIALDNFDDTPNNSLSPKPVDWTDHLTSLSTFNDRLVIYFKDWCLHMNNFDVP